MSASILMIVALVSLATGYAVYGRYIARTYGLDRDRPTPAHTRRDGVDYVPAKVPVLMGPGPSDVDRRCGAQVSTIEEESSRVFDPDAVPRALQRTNVTWLLGARANCLGKR
jgi:carbon starvation CstA-like protein